DLRLTAGTLSVAAASTLNGAFALEGGTVTGTGDLTVNGTFRWSSGTMSGKATTTAQGGLALGDGLKVLDGRTLNVPGPLTWTGGDVVLQNGATWGVPPNQSGLAPYAVLQVSNVTAPALTVGEYVPVTVTWTVTNIGTGAGVTSRWTDTIIATPNATLGKPVDEIVLDRVVHDGALGPTASYTGTDTFTLPL